MKTKQLLIAAAVLTALAACTSDDFVGNQDAITDHSDDSRAISFGSANVAMTRADQTGATAAGLLKSNFVVEGVKGNGTALETVFDHYNVNWVTNTANTTTSNTNDWEYVAQTKHDLASIAAQSIKYWDYSAAQYDFIAFSKGSATAVYAAGDYDEDANVLFTKITPSTLGTSAYTVKGKADNLAKVYIADMVTAYRGDPYTNGDYNKVVTFKFRSLSAKVRIALYETVPGYSVKDVVFYTDEDTKDSPTEPAKWGTAHLFTTGDDVFNEEGTYTVYFPTTGSANKNATDYNKAHLSFVGETSGGTETAKSFGTLTGSLTAANLDVAEVSEASGNKYLGRSSSTATYAGTFADKYYTTVIPNETGAVLNLKVDYKLVSTDGSGEEINVTGATAQVPKEFASWKSGYAYTYLFKISQNTNGWTNPSAGPAGLYPITFDAVVTETEEDVQETITTVATPSITTYAKGAVVTGNNEYTVGDNIYVMVNNGTLTADNTNLYTLTLEAGAAQTINEASVANALANGTYDGTAKTYTVRDANGKAMVLTEATDPSIVTEVVAADSPNGNAITGINAAKFKPATAGTYVFEYVITARTSAVYYTQEEINTAQEGDDAYNKTTSDIKTKANAGSYAYKIIKIVN